MRYFFNKFLDKISRTCSFGSEAEDVGGAAPAEAVTRHDRRLVDRGRLKTSESVGL